MAKDVEGHADITLHVVDKDITFQVPAVWVYTIDYI